MTRSIAFATLLAAALGGCAQKPAEPPPVASANAGVTGFIAYCGPVWSVDRQGYVQIPCPAGTNYDSLR
ncbi:hypothetical protein BH10PSE7_BH10PSE7_44280 [soil metagenome]